jgi:hypothetical protein
VRKIRQHTKAELRAMGATPGLMAHRVGPDGRSRLEQLNQKIKRRTRVVRIFPNKQACLRLVTALAV